MRQSIDQGRRLFDAIQEDNITFLAAAIAFYAVMSIFPLVLLVVVIGSWLGGEAFAALVVTVIQDFLTPQTESLVEETLIEGPGRGGVGLLSVLVLIWSALKVFRALAVAFSIIYGDKGAPNFLHTIIQATTVLIAIGFGFLAMFLVNAVVRFLAPAGALPRFTPVAVFLFLSLLFLPVYLVFPTDTPTLGEVLPGALLAAAGWTILGELFGLYAANATTFALFGVIGGFLLLLTWFYFGAIVLLVGAEVNAVISSVEQQNTFLKTLTNDDSAEERTLGDGPHSPRERDE